MCIGLHSPAHKWFLCRCAQLEITEKKQDLNAATYCAIADPTNSHGLLGHPGGGSHWPYLIYVGDESIYETHTNTFCLVALLE